LYKQEIVGNIEEEQKDRTVEKSINEVIELLNSLTTKIICVRGNCDSEVDQMVLNFPLLATYGVIENNNHLIYL